MSAAVEHDAATQEYVEELLAEAPELDDEQAELITKVVREGKIQRTKRQVAS